MRTKQQPGPRSAHPKCAGFEGCVRQRLRHLVVRDHPGGKIIGVISVGDMVKYRLEQLESETAVLRDYVAAQRASR